MSKLQFKMNNPFDEYLGRNFKDDIEAYSSVFHHFDTKGDGYLDEEEFGVLLQNLFQHEVGNGSQSVTQADITAFFTVLDLNKDGKLSMEEFRCAWLYWLRQILQPVKALVMVDVQNDFISGSLSLSGCPAGQDGSVIIPVINSILDQNLFDMVVYTYDWHPEDHISFIDNVKHRKMHSSSKVDPSCAKVFDTVMFDVDGTAREQNLWPRHCTQGSWGSQLHPDLKVVENAFHVQKGMNSNVDSYSAFWDNDKLSKTELSSILSERKITDVYLCGLAYDVCVGFTGKHSVEHGFRTVFIEDASRGVTLDGIAKTRENLCAKGVHFAHSSQVPLLTRSELRPVSLAAQAALNYKLAWKIVKDKYKYS